MDHHCAETAETGAVWHVCEAWVALRIRLGSRFQAPQKLVGQWARVQAHAVDFLASSLPMVFLAFGQHASLSCEAALVHGMLAPIEPAETNGKRNREVRGCLTELDFL